MIYHRARRDHIGWGSVSHPPDCLDSWCPVVRAVAAGRIFRNPPGTFGVFDLHLDAAGLTVEAKRVTS